MHNDKRQKFKLNKKYYLLEDGESELDADYLVVREDKFTYYIVDSMSINRCNDKDDQGLTPLYEIDKHNNGNGYNKEQVEACIVRFLISMGIRL